MWIQASTAPLVSIKRSDGCFRRIGPRSFLDSNRQSEEVVHCGQWFTRIKSRPLQCVASFVQQGRQNGLCDEQRKILSGAHLGPAAEMVEGKIGRSIHPLVGIKHIRRHTGLFVPVVKGVQYQYLCSREDRRSLDDFLSNRLSGNKRSCWPQPHCFLNASLEVLEGVNILRGHVVPPDQLFSRLLFFFPMRYQQSQG